MVSPMSSSAMGGPQTCPPPPPKFPPTEADFQHRRLSLYLVAIWVTLVGLVLVQRLLIAAHCHIRKLVGINNEKQAYFTKPNTTWAAFKRHWLDAPLLRKRHNREFQLSSAVNIGTLPTRIQTVLIVAYLILNTIFCSISLPPSSDPLAFLPDFYHRTGVISVTNMIPLFVLAGRNNPLILLLDISFDSYNLLHRWLGRIVVLEAIVHAVGFSWYKILRSGWYCFWQSLGHSTTLLTGAIAICAFTVLLLHSPSIVRHAFYETFLHVHICLAFIVLIVIWIHLDGLPIRSLFAAVIAAWLIERAFRLKHLLLNNIGAGNGTHAEIEALPGDAMRVTLHLARPWTFRPGQHVFLYIPAIGLWTNHPFSVAWSSSDASPSATSSLDKHRRTLALEPLDMLARPKPTMSLLIRRRTGFTDALWRRASASATGTITARAFVEGPYGGLRNLASYGTVVLFAAGIGITHQVAYCRALIAGHADGTAATRRVTLVWIIQSPEHLEWIRPWMAEVLAMEKRRDVLRVMLFVTRPRSTKEIHSPSASVQMFPGKPDVAALVRQAQLAQVGAMAVSVCGTGSLSDDVRAAVRKAGRRTTVDFFEEAFSW